MIISIDDFDKLRQVEAAPGSALIRRGLAVMSPDCVDDELAHTDEKLRLARRHRSLKERLLDSSIGFVRWAKGVVETAD